MRMSDMLTLFDYNYWATGRILEQTVRLSSEQFLMAPGGHRSRGTKPRAMRAPPSGVSRRSQMPSTFVFPSGLSCVPCATMIDGIARPSA